MKVSVSELIYDVIDFNHLVSEISKLEYSDFDQIVHQIVFSDNSKHFLLDTATRRVAMSSQGMQDHLGAKPANWLAG